MFLLRAGVEMDASVKWKFMDNWLKWLDSYRVLILFCSMVVFSLIYYGPCYFDQMLELEDKAILFNQFYPGIKPDRLLAWFNGYYAVGTSLAGWISTLVDTAQRSYVFSWFSLLVFAFSLSMLGRLTDYFGKTGAYAIPLIIGFSPLVSVMYRGIAVYSVWLLLIVLLVDAAVVEKNTKEKIFRLLILPLIICTHPYTVAFLPIYADKCLRGDRFSRKKYAFLGLVIVLYQIIWVEGGGSIQALFSIETLSRYYTVSAKVLAKSILVFNLEISGWEIGIYAGLLMVLALLQRRRLIVVDLYLWYLVAAMNAMYVVSPRFANYGFNIPERYWIIQAILITLFALRMIYLTFDSFRLVPIAHGLMIVLVVLMIYLHATDQYNSYTTDPKTVKYIDIIKGYESVARVCTDQSYHLVDPRRFGFDVVIGSGTHLVELAKLRGKEFADNLCAAADADLRASAYRNHVAYLLSYIEDQPR